ncbi:MAG: ATP-binding protein [Candidatus Latescibacterota bacterium]|jgi:PAS domain S-box-containing protein
MVRIAGTILQYTDLDDILTDITRELNGIIPLDRASVAFCEPQEARLVLGHIHTSEGVIDDPGQGRVVPLDESSVVGWVAIHRKPSLRNNIPHDDRFNEVVKEARLKSDIVVPLVVRDNLIGTLNIGSYKKNAFTDEDLEDVVHCSHFVCGAIEHAVLMAQAREITDRYQTLQKSASDIFMLIERNTGKLMEVNRKCCETLGYEEDELLKRSYFDLFPKEEQFQARRDFINVLSQKSKSFVDRRLIRRDGEILFVDINAKFITLKDESFIQIVVHDISQRKMLEQQIILQNKKLQETNRSLRDVDQMKSEFLANISHELRTPLSIIIAYSESLRHDSVSPEERRDFLTVIIENGQSLLRLIDDLLDLSQLEASATLMNRSLSHVHDVVRSLWPRVEPLAAEKRIDLSFDPGQDIPVVNIDNRRILQVLMSLIHNAIKFTGEGGGVVVRTRRDDEGVIVTIEDDGVGIAANEMPAIFDTFRQLDGSSTRRSGGLGIGLAMAKHIVEQHGGRLWAESEEGKGSVFFVVLPEEPDDSFPYDTAGSGVTP